MDSAGGVIAAMNKQFIQQALYRKKKAQDEARAKAIMAKNDYQEKTETCPFPYFDRNDSTGGYEKVQVECKVGPGVWCGECIHKARHVYQKNKNKAAYEKAHEEVMNRIKKTGLAPHLWNDPIAKAKQKHYLNDKQMEVFIENLAKRAKDKKKDRLRKEN